jgi:rod shape-determining protein MreC
MLLVIVSMALMVLDHRYHHLESIRGGLTVLISPLQYAADLPASVANWGSESLSTRGSLQRENDALKADHLQYQLRLQKMAALEAENQRLRELLQSATAIPDKVLIGELLAVDMDPFKRQVVLNRGTGSGIYEGQPLLDAYGVMGQIIHVTPVESVAILITDASHAVPVQINRTGQRAIAVGTGEPNKLDIPHLPTNADIQVGDLLVTSGLGGRFPPGYPVGKVISVERDPAEPYAEVVAEPTARLERSREVLLVLRQEADHLLPAAATAPAAAPAAPANPAPEKKR